MGRPVPAKLIFSMSIRYLKEHMLQRAVNTVSGIMEHDIQWVLTVPAIWDDAAKQFMREAATEASSNPACRTPPHNSPIS
jgi:molecular chaperone DnaK (HSP70)